VVGDGDLREDAAFFQLVRDSYARVVGMRLVQAGQDASWLYRHAGYALLAHNTEADPRFIYANRTAQSCFEYSWEEFVQLRSRFSAEAPDRLERQRQLEAVTREGYVSGYRGIRVARSGRRFWIENGVIWQLVDARGICHGQAAVFDSWAPV
jgi:MEKHLA domain